MQNKSEIYVRPATIEDLEFIIGLVPRLTEFGPPHWRNAAQMIEVDKKVLTDKLINQPPGTIIFIAEDKDKIPLGFIHAHAGSDYYNKEPHGHISDVIVAPEGEGKGIGTLLIEKAEDWARQNGWKWLSLSVFSKNTRAREIYERMDYGRDIIKFVKEL